MVDAPQTTFSNEFRQRNFFLQIPVIFVADELVQNEISTDYGHDLKSDREQTFTWHLHSTSFHSSLNDH